MTEPAIDTAVYSSRAYKEHAYIGPRTRYTGGWRNHPLRGRCGAAASHTVQNLRTGEDIPFSVERPKHCTRCARLVEKAHR